MFAKRANWTLTPNTITVLKENLQRQGEAILDLTESNPTRCGFNYPVEKILSALASPDNLCYDPHPQGMLRAREAVCGYYQKKNIMLHPEQIFLTASTSEGYSFLFRLLGNAKDNVLSPRPSYPLFEFLAGINDLELTTYPLRYKDHWFIDRARLEQEITAKTRAVIVVNPNNPTGSFVTAQEIADLSNLCQQHDLAMISDEVFHDYTFSQEQFPSLAGENNCLTFTLGGLSKSLGLPQMKVSWIILSGPSKKVTAAHERLEIIADTYLSLNTPAQNALKSWLDLAPVIQSEILKRVRNNRQALSDLLANHPLCIGLHADGGWYCVIKCSRPLDEEDFVLQLLAKEKVFVHPGYFFDFEESHCFVISLLPTQDIFTRGVSRFLQRLEKSLER